MMSVKSITIWATIISLVVFIILFSGCTTEQQRAKQWGGSAAINLEPGQKLVMATWKDTDIWFLVRDMTPADTPQTYKFYESSSWGMFEGTIIIHESR